MFELIFQELLGTPGKYRVFIRHNGFRLPPIGVYTKEPDSLVVIRRLHDEQVTVRVEEVA